MRNGESFDVRETAAVQEEQASAGARLLSWLGRLFFAVIIPLITFAILYAGFLFLRDANAPKWIVTLVAIVWGVGGVALLFWVFNGIVERMSDQWTARIQPYVFVGPALAILDLVFGGPCRTHILVEPK